MALNWWLIIVAIVMTALLIIANLYILAYFQHPEDKNVALWPKLVVLLSLTLAEASVLLLPFDVANRGSGMTLDVEVVWNMVYMIIGILVVFIIPFSLFFYESDDESLKKQLSGAFGWTFGCFLVFALIFGLMYGLAGYTDIEYVRHTGVYIAEETSIPLSCSTCTATAENISFRVTFPVYLVAVISFVGWFFFVLFGGIGLPALPMDLINGFRTRPKRIDLSEYAKQKIVIRERSQKLLDIGKRMEEEGRHLKKNRANKKLYNKFRQAVYFLERDYEVIKKAYKEQGGSPVWEWFKLFLGLVSIICSTMWIIHIIVFMFMQPPSTPFLNDMFVHLDNTFPFLGTCFYGLFSGYLLWAIMKGNFKFGLRFFFFEIHPMKIEGTLMNSFLFNSALILICSVSVVQFCTDAFNLYTRLTVMDMLFGNQIRNLRFFSYFWSYGIFLYSFFGIAALSFLVFLFFPKDRSKEDELDADTSSAYPRMN